jgi:uncharacterized C2H2 Zn-finger protein
MLCKRRTSAKGNFKPRRVRLVCPVCGTVFSLNYSEYRKHVKAGTRPTCSRSCGQTVRRGKVPA